MDGFGFGGEMTDNGGGGASLRRVGECRYEECGGGGGKSMKKEACESHGCFGKIHSNDKIGGFLVTLF